MRDILENITTMDERIKEEERRKELSKATKKAIKDEFLKDKATDFAVKFESLSESKFIQDNFSGRFNSGSGANDRADNFIAAVETLNRMSKDKDNLEIVEGHPLYISDKYKKNLISTARKMFKELSDVNLKEDIYQKCRTTETQSFLNEICIGSRGKDATEGTAENHKARIQKINLIEAIATGKFNDYSSGIQTKYDTEKFNGAKKVAKDEPNRQFRSEDYERMREGIMEKLREAPEKVTDPEIAVILAGDFMLRKSTIERISAESIDPKVGTIEVYEKQNKSRQAFVATGSYTAQQSPEYTEALSLIKQRAKIRYADRPNKDGTTPLVTCSEQYLYKGFNKLMKEYDVQGDWKGAYHALRHMGAQRRYDEIRGQMEEDYPQESSDYWRIHALKELNYELGHGPEHLDTTMGYVKNIW